MIISDFGHGPTRSLSKENSEAFAGYLQIGLGPGKESSSDREVIGMPEFSNPFTVKKSEKKLTKEELIRSIRFMVAAEFEAVQMYVQTAESTDDKLAAEVLMDIADEEKVHAGEFLRLLKELDPREQDFLDEGADEVEEMMEELED